MKHNNRGHLIWLMTFFVLGGRMVVVEQMLYESLIVRVALYTNTRETNDVQKESINP